MATLDDLLDTYRDAHTMHIIERVKAEAHRAIGRPTGIAKIRGGDALVLALFAESVLAASPGSSSVEEDDHAS